MTRGAMLMVGIAVLVLFVGAFTYLSNQQWMSPSPVSMGNEASAVSAGLMLAVKQAGQPAEYTEILQRPVFRSDRRQPIAAVPVPTPLKPEVVQAVNPEDAVLKRSTLAGIFASGAHTWVLVLANQQAHRVEMGQTLAGWRLNAVGDVWADFLSAKGEVHRLIMKPVTADTALSPSSPNRTPSMPEPVSATQTVSENQPNGRNLKP